MTQGRVDKTFHELCDSWDCQRIKNLRLRFKNSKNISTILALSATLSYTAHFMFKSISTPTSTLKSFSMFNRKTDFHFKNDPSINLFLYSENADKNQWAENDPSFGRAGVSLFYGGTRDDKSTKKKEVDVGKRSGNT